MMKPLHFETLLDLSCVADEEKGMLCNPFKKSKTDTFGLTDSVHLCR